MKKRTPSEIVNSLIKEYNSLREFARAISEDGSDVIRWRLDRTKVRPRAVVSICRLHPDIKPHELNPDIFPEDLSFTFGDK